MVGQPLLAPHSEVGSPSPRANSETRLSTMTLRCPFQLRIFNSIWKSVLTCGGEKSQREPVWEAIRLQVWPAHFYILTYRWREIPHLLNFLFLFFISHFLCPLLTLPPVSSITLKCKHTWLCVDTVLTHLGFGRPLCSVSICSTYDTNAGRLHVAGAEFNSKEGQGQGWRWKANEGYFLPHLKTEWKFWQFPVGFSVLSWVNSSSSVALVSYASRIFEGMTTWKLFSYGI